MGASAETMGAGYQRPPLRHDDGMSYENAQMPSADDSGQGNTAAGRIIVINGASSSGKTSLASELLPLLPTAHFLMSVDDFNAMRARRELTGPELEVVLRRTRAGFHRAVAAMAQAGNDVVVDLVLSEEWRWLDCVRVFAGVDVLFVGVKCDLRELERRESTRADREPGLARRQWHRVHLHDDYDVVVETDKVSAREAARAIARAASGRRPDCDRAFDRLRRRLDS